MRNFARVIEFKLFHFLNYDNIFYLFGEKLFSHLLSSIPTFKNMIKEVRSTLKKKSSFSYPCVFFSIKDKHTHNLVWLFICVMEIFFMPRYLLGIYYKSIDSTFLYKLKFLNETKFCHDIKTFGQRWCPVFKYRR